MGSVRTSTIGYLLKGVEYLGTCDYKNMVTIQNNIKLMQKCLSVHTIQFIQLVTLNRQLILS